MLVDMRPGSATACTVSFFRDGEALGVAFQGLDPTVPPPLRRRGPACPCRAPGAGLMARGWPRRRRSTTRAVGTPPGVWSSGPACRAPPCSVCWANVPPGQGVQRLGFFRPRYYRKCYSADARTPEVA